MPRPKGCRCPKPDCPIHPGKNTGAYEDVVKAAAAPYSAQLDPEPDGTPPPLIGLDGGQQGKTKKDAPPRRRKRERTKPISPDAPDDTALTTMLAELLTMPAIPAAMLLDCDYCRDHFIAEGPKAARELVALSIVNPALRGALESLHAGWTRVTIVGVVASYFAKPALHHLAPDPILATAGPVIGVPPRPPKPKHTHDAASSQAEHTGPFPDEAEHDSPAPEDQSASDQAA